MERLGLEAKARRATSMARNHASLNDLFKRVFTDNGVPGLVGRGSHMRRRWRRAYGPEYRAHQDGMEAKRAIQSPPVIVQDDRWRAEVEERAQQAIAAGKADGARRRWQAKLWSWPLVCAIGSLGSGFTACVGGLERENERMGARLLCLAHHPRPSIYPETFREWEKA